MQDTNKKRFKKKIEQLSKYIKAKKLLIILIAIVILASCIITIATQTIKRNIQEIEERPLLEYEIKGKAENNKYNLLVKINSIDGIETVKYISSTNGEEIQLYCNGNMVVGIDYEVEDTKDYDFKIKVQGKVLIK